MKKTAILIGITVALFFAFSPVGHASSQGCAAPPAGIVGWWPGDGNPNDIVNGNSGTLMGGVMFVPGEVGQAFSFNGTNFVQVPNSPALEPANVTVEAWIKTTFLPSPYSAHFIVAKSGSDGYHGYELGTTVDGKVRFTVLGGGPYGDAVGTSLVADGEWHHIAGTFDGSYLRIYVDGNLDATVLYTGGIAYIGSSPLYIGKRQYEGIPGFFNGLVDEVEIYNEALSAEDIVAIVKAGSAGKCRTCTAPPPDLVSWWAGDGNPNDLVDGNNGTLMNGATFAAGMVGQAFSFDGVKAVMDIPDAANLDLANDFTIEMWVNPGQTQKPYADILRKEDSGSAF